MKFTIYSPSMLQNAVMSLTASYGSSQPAQPFVPPHSDLAMALLCFASLRLLQRLTDPLVSSPGNCCICLRSVRSYSHDALLEVATEGVGLVVLDLTVLHRAASQVVIQLCGIDGRAALLVLGGVLPDPKVDVLGEKAAHSPGLGCSQRGRVRSRLTSADFSGVGRRQHALCYGASGQGPFTHAALLSLCSSTARPVYRRAEALIAPFLSHIWGS